MLKQLAELGEIQSGGGDISKTSISSSCNSTLILRLVASATLFFQIVHSFELLSLYSVILVGLSHQKLSIPVSIPEANFELSVHSEQNLIGPEPKKLVCK